VTPVLLGALLIGAGTSTVHPVEAQDRIRGPLPLEVAASVQGHAARMPVGLSPDGQWMAHTVATIDRVARDPVLASYTSTGVSLSEGDARSQATVTHTRTGESIALGSPEASSWAPVWSPDGRRVAFYSDEGGAASLWVWDLETRAASGIPGLIVRPNFGFEGPRWSPDGERLLVKALPEGVSVAEANARHPMASSDTGGSAAVEDASPVVIRRAGMGAPERDATSPVAPDDPRAGFGVDLVVVDLASESMDRVVVDRPVWYYAWSPDGDALAYSTFSGIVPNSQQPLFSLSVRDLVADEHRLVAEDVHLSFGMEWHWSPDGSALAYTSSGSMGTGEMVLVDAQQGGVRVLGQGDTPGFDPGEGEVPPHWSEDGTRLYGVGDGDLWRVEVSSGRPELLASIPGWRIVAVATPFEHPVIWTGDEGREVAVLARAPGVAAIFLVDREDGAVRLLLEEEKSYPWAAFNFIGNPGSGDLTVLSSDQHSLGEVWVLDSHSGELRQGTRLNPDMDRYALGEAGLLQWTSPDGEERRGALLLPPGHQGETPLPLVVWIYGGTMGSNFVNRFGLQFGDIPAFNNHILATRGYAVLLPDAPVRTGTPAQDVVDAVLPAVEESVEAGYADPDRIAIMGQSFGAYNVLSVLTRSELFRAAVITGVLIDPNLFTAYLDQPGYYEQGQGRMGGSIWEYPERYQENSPIFRFDRIETPLLIGHGDRDANVTAAESIFRALQRLDKPVEYRLYCGEGHAITQPANVVDFWERRLEFLAHHLGLEVASDGFVRALDPQNDGTQVHGGER
jgi:dipeptidyl aminopeptidase/acylaminoacyl peptidase